MRQVVRSMKKHLSSAERDISKLSRVLFVVFFFMLLEIWGHYASNSLSLLADSLHMCVDFLGILISLISLKIAKRKATTKMPFGYGRYEIIGAIISISLIWIALVYLILESYQKIMHPKRINGKIFLMVSVVGMFVNLFCLSALHPKCEGSHRNLNIRAAYVHMVGDLIQSIGIVIASIVTLINPKLVVVDIACTICFSIIILFSTLYIIKDAIQILAEHVPKDVNTDEICEALSKIDNFASITKFYCWSINMNSRACAIIIRVSEIWRYESGMVKAKEILKAYDFDHIIIEFETERTAKYIESIENMVCVANFI